MVSNSKRCKKSAKLKLELTAEEVLELEEVRDRASKPYLRGRAAILKIARETQAVRELRTAYSILTASCSLVPFPLMPLLWQF
jgi:hypothetical protein